MARRSDHTRAELHTLILNAARDIVAREGPAALTIRRIGKAIGYSPGTLYNLFEDLDDIIVHLNAATLDRLYEALSGVEPGRDGEATLLALAACYVSFTRDQANLWRILFQGLPNGTPRPAWYYRRIERLFVPVEDALGPLFGQGRDAERRRSARVLWAALHGMCSLATAEAVLSWEDVDGMAATLVRTYAAGLRHDTSGPHGARVSNPGKARAQGRKAKI